MNIFLFHGDDLYTLEKEYSKFLSGKSGYKRIYINEGDNIENIFADLLFAEKRLYIIENIKLLTDKFINLIIKDKYKNNILAIYHTGTIRADLKNKFIPKPVEYKFILPKEIFKFLDILFLKNSNAFAFSYKKVKDLYPQELILHFIFSHIKDLILESYGVGIAPVWKKYTLVKQLERVSPSKLKNILQELSLLDFKIKTGMSNPTALDLYVYKNLE